MRTLSVYLSNPFNVVTSWRGVVVGSTECKGNQIWLGKHTDGVMQRRMLGFPSPVVGV